MELYFGSGAFVDSAVGSRAHDCKTPNVRVNFVLHVTMTSTGEMSIAILTSSGCETHDLNI